MAVNVGQALKDDLLVVIDTLFPAGSHFKCYTGSRPSSPDDTATGTLLYDITLPASPWAAVSGGAKAKQGTWSATTTNAGTAGWARLSNSGDTYRVDFTVGTSSADFIVATTTVSVGKTNTVDTLTVTFGTAKANVQNSVTRGYLDRLDTTFPASSATWKFYTGSRPAATTDAVTGTVLWQLTLPASAWAAASGTTKAKSTTVTWAVAAFNPVGTQTAGYGRMANSGDSIRIDFTVGTSGTDLVLDDNVLIAKTPTVYVGLVIDSLTLSMT